MITGISATDLGTYVEYLKQENETVNASDLSYSLEDCLDFEDAASVIEIDDKTKMATGVERLYFSANGLAEKN